MSTAIGINNTSFTPAVLRADNAAGRTLAEQVQNRVAELVPAEEQQAVTASVMKVVSSANFDFSKMSIDAVVSAVMLDRYDAIRKLTEDQAKKVKDMNNQLRGLGQLKAALATYGTDNSKPSDKIPLDKPGAKLDDLKNIIKEYGLNINLDSLVDGITITQGNLASLNETVNTETSSTTNIQSIEYNTLQDYAQKLTQSLDLASNVSKKFFDTNSGIVANMR
jgi:hypothetical protein